VRLFAYPALTRTGDFSTKPTLRVMNCFFLSLNTIHIETLILMKNESTSFYHMDESVGLSTNGLKKISGGSHRRSLPAAALLITHIFRKGRCNRPPVSRPEKRMMRFAPVA